LLVGIFFCFALFCHASFLCHADAGSIRLGDKRLSRFRMTKSVCLDAILFSYAHMLFYFVMLTQEASALVMGIYPDSSLYSE
jgi:hypothetical protein